MTRCFSIPSRKKSRFHKTLRLWYKKNKRDLPWRKIRNPYAILVSELMLQQTQVDRVVEKYQSWMKRFPTIISLAQATPAEVIAAWQGLGYNRRALYLHRVAKEITTTYNGRFPKEYATLRLLPGIGKYTARALQSFAFSQREPVLDTNIRRVIGRIFVGYRRLQKMSEDDCWQLARCLLPPRQSSEFHQAIMDFGSLICTAKKPKCHICPMQTLCRSYPAIQSASSKDLQPLKIPRERAYFGQPRRIWRGKILNYLNRQGSATEQRIGKAIQEDFSPRRLPWLRSVIATLEKDGLVRRTRNRISLPES